jgi:hypothetical protein
MARYGWGSIEAYHFALDTATKFTMEPNPSFSRVSISLTFTRLVLVRDFAKISRSVHVRFAVGMHGLRHEAAHHSPSITILCHRREFSADSLG